MRPFNFRRAIPALQSIAMGVLLLQGLSNSSAQLAPPPEDCELNEGYPHRCHYTCWYDLCSDPADAGPACPGDAGGDGCCGGKKENAAQAPAQGPGSPTPVPPDYRGMMGAPADVLGGMPFWWVEEPSLRLFLRDKPFFYNTSRGISVEFSLTSKSEPGQAGQVDARQYAIFGVGTNWSTPWRSYLQQTDAKDPTSTEDEAWFCFLGDGSARKYPLGAPEFVSRAVLTKSNSDYCLTFPSGARNVYGQWVTLGTSTYCFLSRHESVDGHVTQFTYSFSTSGSVTNTIRLQSVADPDGRQTTFTYVTNNAYYSNLISQVNGPYGLTAALGYNSQGQLTNLTDVVGLSSGIRYGASGRVACLDTPYGTTSFSYPGTNGWTAVRVEELGQRRHLHLRGYNLANVLSTAEAEGAALNSFLGEGTVQTEHFDTRNTFYWGPRQYDHLPLSIRTNLAAGVLDPANLTTNDFKLGWTRHWLRGRSSDTNEILSITPSVIRAPSPSDDGSVEGLLTWFDYEEKDSGKWEYVGKRSSPTTIASREPGGQWRVQRFQRNTLGNPTSLRETITAVVFDDWDFDDEFTTTWRTNWFTYSENQIDLTEHWRHSDSGADLLVSSNAYNGFHQIVMSFNAEREMTTLVYNSSNQLASVTRPSGLISEYSYDGSGLLAAIVEKTNSTALRTNSYAWTNGYLRMHVNPRGLTNSYAWDALGRLTSSASPDGTVTHSYGKLDRVKTLDRLGFTNAYAFNGFGQLTHYTNANHKIVTRVYCDCGALEAIIDPLGNTNSFAYDNRGRMTRRTYPDLSWVEAAYDLFDQPVRVTASGGLSVTNEYSIHGLPMLRSAVGGMLERRLYNASDWMTNHVDQNGLMTAWQFDGSGRVLTREVLDGTAVPPSSYGQELFGYSSLGLIVHSNALAKATLFEYDALGHKTVEINPLNETNRFAYDAAGSLTNLVDGKGNQTSWKLDAYGRVTNKTDAAGAVVFAYGYDANDRLTNRWTPAKLATSYSHDALGNLTKVDYPSSADVVLTYDANNRLISMIDGVGTTTYGYTSFGALQSEDGPWADDTVSYSHTHRRRTGLAVQQPSGTGWSQTYSYDDLMRLTNVTSPAGAFGYAYRTGLVDDYRDPWSTQVPETATLGNLVRTLKLPSGAYVTNAHDVYGRLTSTTLRNSGHTNLNLHSYALNAGNQRTSQTRLGASSVDYTYDDDGQLLSALGLEADGTTHRWQERFFYSYDAAGNLSNRVQNVLTNVFAVDSRNQLTSVVRTNSSFTVAGVTHGAATSVTVAANGGAATAAIRYADQSFARTNVTLLNGNNTFVAVGTDATGRGDTNTLTLNLPVAVTFLYDQNGNLRTNGTRILEYDDENQLTRVTEPNSWKSEFSYDGRMRRRVRKEYEWRNSAWVMTTEVRYVYDENLVIQERDQLNQPKVTYSRGQDLSGSLEGAGGIGGLLARTEHDLDAKVHVYYSADGNGNVTCLVDTNQLVVGRYLYDPFGNTLAAIGPAAEANLYRFSSKELHVASGLAYYLYRYYDPNLQRWVNRDPIGERGGLNLYGFVRNSPCYWVDIFGLTVFPPGFVGPIQPGDFITPQPPPGIPGGPWKWIPDPQNPRGGAFFGPKPPKSWRPICTWAAPGTVNDNKDPYWKTRDPDGFTQRYDSDGNPITAAEAHEDTSGEASFLFPALVTPGVPGLIAYPTVFPAPQPLPVPVPVPVFP